STHTLSLHDALPICWQRLHQSHRRAVGDRAAEGIARSGRSRARQARRGSRAPAGELIMPKLSRAEIEERVKKLRGWTLEGDAIKKQYTFAGFPEAVAFVNRLAPEAERADHHPDILINYKRVTLTYSTHSEGGLTEKDFAGAAAADRLARAR